MRANRRAQHGFPEQLVPMTTTRMRFTPQSSY